MIKNVIAIRLFIVLFLVIMVSISAKAQTGLEKKVDSLFVIASSGEVKFLDMVEPAQDSIAAMGESVVPHLVGKFTTKSARERLTIIQILKKIGSPAVPYLITSLKNPNGLVVQRVCWALGDIADTSAVEALIEVSTHSRWQVRDEALGALGDIKDSRGSDAVLYGFNDPVGQVRKAAAVAAGKIEIIEAVSILAHQLGDEFYGARMSAMESLLKLDTGMVIEAVSDSVNSANNFIGSLGCLILSEIKTDEAVDLLKNIFETSSEPTRTHAAVAIIRADPENRCGYHELLLEETADSLAVLKIKSALPTY